MKLRGAVHKFGANVDTDVIIPARYLNVSEPAELAALPVMDMQGNIMTRREMIQGPRAFRVLQQSGFAFVGLSGPSRGCARR